jgi:hypothetical protein
MSPAVLAPQSQVAGGDLRDDLGDLVAVEPGDEVAEHLLLALAETLQQRPAGVGHRETDLAAVAGVPPVEGETRGLEGADQGGDMGAAGVEVAHELGLGQAAVLLTGGEGEEDVVLGRAQPLVDGELVDEGDAMPEEHPHPRATADALARRLGDLVGPSLHRSFGRVDKLDAPHGL